MKKQLFLLLVAILAISISSTYAQLTPRPVTCLSADALHPIPGNPYTYEVNVPTPPGTKEYLWFVTQDPNFIAAGTLTTNRETVPSSTVVAATGTGYNDPTTGTSQLSLTWKSFAYNPANPVFVVIQVKNTSSAGDACVSQNMKVYKIQPLNAFTLDIANQDASQVTQAGYGTNIPRCIHDIVTSTYVPESAPGAGDDGVLMDFGQDILYYEVVAANWSEAWRPSIQLTGVDPLEHVTVEFSNNAAWTTPVTMTDAGGGLYTTTATVTPASGTFVGSAGQSIFIRVTLDHSDGVNPSYMGLTDEAITLAVDGMTVPSTGTGVGDVHTVAGGTPSTCPWVDGFANDVAVQTLKARPDIISNTGMPVLPFLPVRP
ncbi:MAG: hypothetical protein HXX13_01765 [Bacteroidetes bacterium]|nr:hypothetical protein [Bacteroidota bacterium]